MLESRLEIGAYREGVERGRDARDFISTKMDTVEDLKGKQGSEKETTRLYLRCGDGRQPHKLWMVGFSLKMRTSGWLP